MSGRMAPSPSGEGIAFTLCVVRVYDSVRVVRVGRANVVTP